MWAADRVVALTPGSAITIPETANEFAIKGNHLILIKGNQFDGRIKTDPQKHIHEFLRICDMFKYRDTENEAVHLMMFPLSLTGEAKTWLDELNEGTIETWMNFEPLSLIDSFTQLFLIELWKIELFSICENESLTELGLYEGNAQKLTCDDKDEEPQPKPKEPKPVKETPIPKPYKPKITYPQCSENRKMEAQYGNVPRHDIEPIESSTLINVCAGNAQLAEFLKGTLIDVINEILEEDSDALFDEGSKIFHSIEGTILEEKLFVCNLMKLAVALMVSEYFQIPIDPLDQEKTTFTCPFGTYAYRRMPFGLCNAPATFQRCMLAIFHDMIEESVDVFMVNFSVFGNSFDNCLNNLDKMLQRCKDAHLVLNWEKCHFMVKEGIVLGHNVSEAGLEVDKAKIDIISKLPPPLISKLVRHYSSNRFKPCLFVWHMLLQEFDNKIKDRKGIENVAADHLSRIENDETSDDSEVDDNFHGETLMEINTKDEPWFADFLQICTYKTPTGTTPYKLVYGKNCQLLFEFELRTYWALKNCKPYLIAAGEKRMFQLHELD
ncbi:reverse transcriptase domain-containing protein [Tanacetum coccineum]